MDLYLAINSRIMSEILFLVCYIVVAGTGIVFNGYILFVLLWHRCIHTANSVLLLHLAFVDAILCVAVLMYNTSFTLLTDEENQEVTDSLKSVLNQPPGFCEVNGFVWTLLPVAVVWTVCGLSCDRYAAISIPLHYSRVINTRRALIFVAISWILGALVALPPLLGICPYTFQKARWSCAASCITASNFEVSYAIIYVTIAAFVPVIIIVFCNIHILLIARYHRHRMVSAIYEVTLSAQATVTHQRNPCYLSKFKGKSAFLTISQVVGSLLVLTVPYFSIQVWEALNGKPIDSVVIFSATFLLICTSPVNAYIYGVKSRVLRQTLKALLRNHLHKQIPNERIGKRTFVSNSSSLRGETPIRRFSAPAESFSEKTERLKLYRYNSKEESSSKQRLQRPGCAVRCVSLPPHLSTTLPLNIEVIPISASTNTRSWNLQNSDRINNNHYM